MRFSRMLIQPMADMVKVFLPHARSETLKYSYYICNTWDIRNNFIDSHNYFYNVFLLNEKYFIFQEMAQ